MASAVPPAVSAPARTALSPRLAALKEQVMQRKGSWVGDRNPFVCDIALWRAAAPGRSRVQHRAAYLLEMVHAVPIEINPDWSLAGEDFDGPSFGFTGEQKPERMLRLNELGLTPEQLAAARAAVCAWNCDARDPTSGAHTNPPLYAIGEAADDARLGMQMGWWTADGTASTMVYMADGWRENHSIRDYAKVLRVGFGGLRKEIEDLLAAATASIVEIDPALVAGSAGVERLAQIIETAIAIKVGQLQWNVTTVERLLQAQADPEHYGNIQVRVAGFSQMFKLVDRELQNHIIARTKHGN